MSDQIADFERFIRRDPAGRGLISTEAERGPLCPGHLALAGADLAARGTAVGIVTGFFIPHATPPAAETDGPPGAALLAAACHHLGMRAWLITDEPCANAVRAAARLWGLPDSAVVVVPPDVESWLDRFLAEGPGSELSHLIAVERVGPSHTRQTLLEQRHEGPAPLARFEESVPAESRDHCHNMRGRIIDEWTSPLHRLFERATTANPALRTIGIGDGGNEIGMGSIPWEELVIRLNREQAARIPCRIATDWTVIAGTSNWGAWALAAAVCLLRQRVDLLQPWDVAAEEKSLQQLVAEGPAVDGIAGRAEASVDGLPFITYIQPWVAIRRRCGLPE